MSGNKNFGEMVFNARKDLNLSQRNFGKTVNVDGSTIGCWERGNKTPCGVSIKLIKEKYPQIYAWMPETWKTRTNGKPGCAPYHPNGKKGISKSTSAPTHPYIRKSKKVDKNQLSLFGEIGSLKTQIATYTSKQPKLETESSDILGKPISQQIIEYWKLYGRALSSIPTRIAVVEFLKMSAHLGFTIDTLLQLIEAI